MKRVLVMSFREGKHYQYGRNELTRRLGSDFRITHWCIDTRERALSRRVRARNVIKKLRHGRRMGYLGKLVLTLVTGKIYGTEIARYKKGIQMELEDYFTDHEASKGGNDALMCTDDVSNQLDQVREGEYDMLMVLGGPYISDRHLAKFKRAINLHFGVLPQYRGSYTIEWACVKKDFKHVGFTIHEMTRHLDGGRICKRICMTDSRGMSLAKIYERCMREGVREMASLAYEEKIDDCNDGNIDYPVYWASTFSVYEYREIRHMIHLKDN